LRVRPYEVNEGETDAALDQWKRRASRCFEHQRDPLAFIAEAGKAFARIPTRDIKKPLVGVVGEIYVRNNAFSNEEVIRAVEAAGGEAWMAPICEWVLFTAQQDVENFVSMPKTLKETVNQGKRIFKARFLQAEDHKFYDAAGAIIADRHEPSMEDVMIAGKRYIPFNIGGEVLITLGRAVHFVRQGAALIVNCSPFSCMAGTVGASLFSRMEEELQVPMVNLFYEGTGDENRQLEVFLANVDPNHPRSGPPSRTAVRRRRGLLNLFDGIAGHA
ncbi:MAG: hypothetical protein V3T05_09655, partial [Myxococcota bacterium]